MMQRQVLKKQTVMFLAFVMVVLCFLPFMSKTTVEAASNGKLVKIDGNWCYTENGKVNKSYVGMAKNEYGWWYVENGIINYKYTGMAKNEYGWFYMKNGKLDTTYTGMAKNQYGWFYMKNGKLDTTYTGMAKNQYGWFYMKNGKLDKTYTGMAKNSYGWWYMKNGKLDKTYTGMAKNSYGWWYIKNGKLDKTYNGMAKNQYGWWHMTNGMLDKTYIGMSKNQYGWWYIENGKLDQTYTGIAVNAYGMWYMKKGKLDTTYTGEAKYNGKFYNVEKGKVVSEKSVTENIELTIYCPPEEQESGWIQKMCEKFRKLHPEWNITFKYGACYEGDAGKTVTKNPETVDIYFFANDQLAQLIDSDVIMPLSDSAFNYVKETNSKTMVSTVTKDGNIYGFPFTGNTWFMYYDKRVFTEDDVKSLDTMLAKGKVAFPITNSWYFQAFYAAVGGVFCGTNGDNEEAGIVLGNKGTEATKYLVNLVKNPNFVNDYQGSGIEGLEKGDVGAIFSGSWDYMNVAEAIGKENVGICQLPTINVEGKDYALKAFAGSKAIGINTNCKNQKAAVELAQYLSGEEAQLAHYEMRDIVPCNTKLLATEAFKKDALSQAQSNTIANTAIIQPTNDKFYSNWWNNATAMANCILGGAVTVQNAEDSTSIFEQAINGQGQVEDLIKKEIFNNGGKFVKYGEDIYYWQYNNNSFENQGLFGNYSQLYETMNELVCLRADGTKEVILQLEASGDLYIANNKMYFTRYTSANQTTIYSIECRNDKWDIFTLNEICQGRISAVDIEKGIFIFNGSMIYDFISGQTREIKVEGARNPSFLMYKNGILYYQASGVNDYRTRLGEVAIYAVDLNGVSREIVRTNADLYDYDDGGLCEIQCIQIYEGYIYYSYGNYAGSADYYQGGNVARVKLDGSGNEILATSAAEKFYIYGKDGRTIALYAYVYDDLSSIVAKAVDVESKEVFAPNIKYGQLGEVFYGAGGKCWIYENTDGICKDLVVDGDYEKTDSFDERSKLQDVELVDDYVFYGVTYSKYNEEVSDGWRDGYDRVKSVVYMKNLKSGIIEKLYEY